MGITNCGEGGHGGAGSELDSHANMIVAGEQVYVFSERVVRMLMSGLSLMRPVGCKAYRLLIACGCMTVLTLV